MISVGTVVLGGLLVTMWLGLFVKPFIEYLRRETPIPSISDDPKIEDKWQRLVGKGDKSGMWVGRLERLILFGALLLDAKEAASVIGVWLAFKLAAKWEAWNHMSHVPDKIEKVDDLHYAYARRIWAAHGYGTLVLGTGANFLAAGVGAVLTRLVLAWLRCQG